MGILDNNDGTPRPAHASPRSGGAVAEPAGEPTPSLFTGEEASVPRADETIFSVLADRARSRPLSHLWITAVIGAVDAIALGIARPGLWWIAAACASVSGYAAWGIADRAFDRLDPSARKGAKAVGLRMIQVVSIACGILGAVAMVIGFLGASVGRTGPPG